MATYRSEWKYLCSEGQVSLLNSRLKGFLTLDTHAGANGTYLIQSLYFDDWKDQCAFANENGDVFRYKYRIRYYGNASSEIFLERKQKQMNRCHKEKCRITREQSCLLCRGEVHELIYENIPPLLKRFCYDILTRRFVPKLIVRYERTAFVEPITNIRITMDQNIAASYDTEHFFSGDYLAVPLQPKHQHLLEVKFDDILPGYIKNLVLSEDFQQTSFSKYYLGRRTMEGFIR